MEYTQTDNLEYNQYWFYITTPEYKLYPNSMGCGYTGNSKTMTSRMVGITTPKILDSKKNYKYILNTDFNIDGKSSDWWCGNKQYQGLGGIISEEWCTSDKQYRMKTQMNLFKRFIKEDYIMVHLSLTWEDVYYNQPLYKDSTHITKPCKKIWYPNNPDQQYLERLFNVIYKNTFPSPINNLKLSYNDISLFGLSVGTGAISRYINEFPFLQTKPDMYKFPLIKSAVMVAGGSLYCYSKIFSPCFDTNVDQRGCCPSDLSEPNFDNGVIPWSKHPPVILIQSVDDSYADPMASTYYYNIMIKNKVPSKKVLDDTIVHGISSENQINAIIDWVKQYFNPLIPVKPIIPTPTKKCVVNDNTGKTLKVSSLIISLVIVIVLFIILAKEYKNNKDKTIVAGIFLFIVSVILIISLCLTLKNKVKTTPSIIPISPTGSKNLDALPILQRQLMTIRKPSMFTAGQLFDKVVEIKNQIYSDYPDIGGVLVHLADLETLQKLVSDPTGFEFNLSSGSPENPNFLSDCSLLGQNKANCSAWTYLRKDLPPIVFSYSSSTAITQGYWTPSIGFIVDPSMLWPIINTMGVVDSATFGRNCSSDQDPSQLRIFNVGNSDKFGNSLGRCNPKVYTAEGKPASDQEDYCIFKSLTTLTECKNDCSYEKDITNTNCRFKNSGATLNSNSWYYDDKPGFSWDCPDPDYRNWTDPSFKKGVPECYKAVEINWNDISEADRKMLKDQGHSCKDKNKWAKYIPSDNCYATSPALYQPYNTPSEGSITSGKLIQNTNLEVSNNDRNYMYIGDSIDSNTSGPTFSKQTWENCDFSEVGLPINCGAGDQNANRDKNVPISVNYMMGRQFKWLKKDWGRWIKEITKMWKYIYSTMSEKDGYKNKNVGLDGDDKHSAGVDSNGNYYNYDYNWIYGNPCNGADWWENEVNIYVNDTIAKDENSDLNKLFRNSMLGMFYIGKSCEDFVSDLPTGTNYGEGCKFSNSVERCVGYMCTISNMNTQDPTKSQCDLPINGNKITYGELKIEESKRIEASKQAVISFVSKFNTKYRSGLNGITGYKLMTASNAYQTWPSLDKLFTGKLTSADVFIPI
jgi:hypothetical protein